jgi:anti-sigma-K factor RskA
MNCADAKELIDLYALGALDDAKAADVAAHLDTCPECRQMLERAELAVAHLPMALAAASPVKLPSELKGRVLASASRVGQAPGPAPVPLAEQPAERLPTLRSLPMRFNRRSVAAAAAVILLIVALGWGVRLSQALDRERSLRERMSDLANQQAEIVIEVVDAPDGTKLVLLPPTEGSDAYGKVFTRPNLPEVVVMANRLPPPPEGQSYHVWLTADGRQVFAGALPISDQGFGLLIHEASQPGPVYDAVEIRLEPAEATEPSGDAVLHWPPDS